MTQKEPRRVATTNRRVTPPPTDNSLVEWTSYAVEDWINNFADAAKGFADGNFRKGVRETVRLYSLKRWAFILPGGGALRGGKIRPAAKRPATVPPAAAPPSTTTTTTPPGGGIPKRA